jgi:regulatory protein
MDCLARREHSVAELRRKLLAKAFGPDEIDAALAGLQRDGLVSDARFADAFANARHRRGQGPARVQAELQQRGVAGELITTALASVDWEAAARVARQKKFGPDMPDNYADKARQARFLHSRGFTAEQINGALAAGCEQD